MAATLYDFHTHTSLSDGTLSPMELIRRAFEINVFAHLDQWFSEFRVFHRDEGRIVAANDDLMKATIYAMMMLRHAQVETTPRRPREHRPLIQMWGP